jgi:hypothetical protein
MTAYVLGPSGLSVAGARRVVTQAIEADAWRMRLLDSPHLEQAAVFNVSIRLSSLVVAKRASVTGAVVQGTSRQTARRARPNK